MFCLFVCLRGGELVVEPELDVGRWTFVIWLYAGGGGVAKGYIVV